MKLFYAIVVVFLIACVHTNAQNVNNATTKSTTLEQSTPTLRVSRPLNANYTRRVGDRLRLECEFELTDGETIRPTHSDFTFYWVKNYQELVQPKKNYIHVLRKNMSSILIMKHLESFDSGSYMCVGELTSPSGQLPPVNASSETTLLVNAQQTTKYKLVKSNSRQQKYDFNDYLMAGIDNDDSDPTNLNNDNLFSGLDDDPLMDDGKFDPDEFPNLNPTLVETFDDKGFCEPYKGTICAGIITANYSIYSTSAQQQDMIEERLKAIIPILTSKNNNLSERCSTFAIPSLCLFAFPLCDRTTKQPKQICRLDCQRLQQDICKNEYFNVKTLFERTSNVQQAAQASSNFLIDCNQLPPSSDSSNDCLPIVSMTLDKLQATVVGSLNPLVNLLKQKQVPNCMTSNGVDYRGAQSITRSGLKCAKWNAQYSAVMRLSLNSDDSFDHNYCRNPDNDVEPWCFTNDPLKPKDYCQIPKCAGGETTVDVTSRLDDKKIANLIYILLPSILIPFMLVCFLLTVCYCRRMNNPAKNVPHNTSSSTAEHVMHPSRLRMSNASMGQTKPPNKLFAQPGRNVSSKSSIASSNNNNNQNNVILLNGPGNPGELNPFLKSTNYDNHFNYHPTQMMLPPQPPSQQQYYAPSVQSTEHSVPMVKHISPNNLRLLQEIGKGRFGGLYIGELIGSFAPNSQVKVVIKTLDQVKTNAQAATLKLQTSTPNVHNKLAEAAALTTAEEHFLEQEFYNEISMYSTLRNRHLANLIGIYTHGTDKHDQDTDDCTVLDYNATPQCMVFEHLNNGDLHEYLLKRASQLNSNPNPNMMNQFGGSQSNLSAVSSSIGGASSNYINIQQQQRNIADFLYIGQQIAAGMEYLAEQNFIHKDLATRNILMSDNLTIKISIDPIGQYNESYAKDYYKLQMKQMPVRWMSPEALYGRYSQFSDVWSYGVCLWEIFNYGVQPYAGCTSPEAIEMIRDRQLLSIPDECPQRAYTLMLECWHEMPTQRPTFTDILNKLRNWENYYLFNNHQMVNTVVNAAPVPAPIMAPPASFQMTASYSSNSQNSKASSLLGNTASTGVSSSSPPPPPPPPSLPPVAPKQINTAAASTLIQTSYYSPSKNQYQTNLFASKFNLINGGSTNQAIKYSPPSSTIGSTCNQRFYRDPLDQANGARMSQRQFGNINNNHIPTSVQMDNHQFDL